MATNKPTILCIADSSTRLNYIAQSVRKLGYSVYAVHALDQAVAVVANPSNGIACVIIDEDMMLDGFSLPESLKAVSSIPVVLLCDKGSEGASKPVGIDFITTNGS